MIRHLLIVLPALFVLPQPAQATDLAVTMVAQAGSEAAEIAWQLIRDSSDAVVISNYLEQFPNSPYASEARAKLDLLNDRGGLIVAAPEAEPPPTAEDPETAAVPELEGRELAFEIQTALNRLGCDAGTPDGIWGRRSDTALQSFDTHSDAALSSLEPSMDVLRTLEGASGRVCPLVCRATEILQGDRCVTKTCPSGQRLSSSGSCYTPQPRTTPAPSRRSGCFVFNGQSFCE